MKKVIIVHGWESSPEDAWLPWLKKELLQRNYQVIVPALPHPEKPKIADWISFLKQEIGLVDENTLFIGHSIGAQTILRYLEQLPEGQMVGKLILVAPWLTLHELETKEEQEVAQEWLETPINFANVMSHTSEITILLSDDDPWVPLTENKHLFEKNLHARVIVEHAMSHYNREANIVKLPQLLPLIESHG